MPTRRTTPPAQGSLADFLDGSPAGSGATPQAAARAAHDPGRTREEIGREAQRVGREFEVLLEAHHGYGLLARLIAWIVHVPPRVAYRFNPRTGRQELTWAGRACADYVGQAADGRALVVEAKSVSERDHGRLRPDAIAAHQRDHLAATAKAGGVALLVVEFRRPRGKGLLPEYRRFAVPWAAVPWVTLRSAESVGAEDLVGWEFAPGCYLRPFLRRPAPAPSEASACSLP